MYFGTLYLIDIISVDVEVSSFETDGLSLFENRILWNYDNKNGIGNKLYSETNSNPFVLVA